MNNGGPPLEIKVWGEFACFTRPEMKVERVSYPVMTPSAARGVLEAVFWKPEFRWRVREIAVLKEIRYFSILRNEVTKITSVYAAREWANKGGHFFAEDYRAQRHTLALKDTAYLIRADVKLKPQAQEEYHPAKYRDQFRRRVARGQCYLTPYLGCREFAAAFGPPSADDKPIAVTSDLGRILFDIKYEEDGSGRGNPIFFSARLESGVLRVPAELYDEEE